jgi:integrase
MRQRTEQIIEDAKTGTWIARVCYKNTNGKRTAVQRVAKNKSDAKKALKALLDTLEKGGRKAIDADRTTFNELCDFYEKHYLKPAHYVGGKKIVGLRSFPTVRGYIKVFRQHFGGIKLKNISYEHIRTYRIERHSTSTQQSVQRTIATVNRELAYLRRLLNIAERNDWVTKSPFKRGDSLIHQCDEVRRDRVLTHHECQRLIDACTDRRTHLQTLVIAAFDTGCRQGELLKLKWEDVDFAADIITIRAFNTKTMRERKVAITRRLRAKLEEMLGSLRQSRDDSVFGVSEVRKSFKTACKVAGLSDLRFHDLRHVHATNLDRLGFSIAAIGKQLGHTSDSKVTLRYINQTDESTRQVASALDDFHREVAHRQEDEPVFIN